MKRLEFLMEAGFGNVKSGLQNTSSMLKDVAEGRTTEVAWINTLSVWVKNMAFLCQNTS